MTFLSAFTLVEMLIALALTALLVAVVGQVAVQAMKCEQRIDHQTRFTHRAALVFDTMEDDLNGRVSVSHWEHPLSLSASDPQTLSLIAATSTGNGASLHVRRVPSHITYQLKRDGSPDRWSLWRLAQNQTDPKAKPSRELVAKEMTRCDWEIFDGRNWQRSWPPVVRTPLEPELLRMRLQWSDSKSSDIRTFPLGETLVKEAPLP